ncbi:MAG: hypothetical protein LKF79_07785 [Solobacterium sp.]|nr:hypothetical protein [Solobacterium sp.]
MRRKDREIIDAAAIDQIIRACRICRIGLNDHGSVYIVPLSFGYRQSPRPIRSLSDEACEKS